MSRINVNGFNATAAAAAEAAAVEAAALQRAAALQAASYDMYSNAAGQPHKSANGMANSPSSFYPWMKNYNGKNFVNFSFLMNG